MILIEIPVAGLQKETGIPLGGLAAKGETLLLISSYLRCAG